LEQENARLLALTQSGSSSSPQPTPDPALISEVEQLRAQLAAAEERERELAAKLVSTGSTVQEVPVKVEAAESYVPPASPPSRSLSVVPSANKTAASLGLMVCSIHSVSISLCEPSYQFLGPTGSSLRIALAAVVCANANRRTDQLLGANPVPFRRCQVRF
jgi:hypothetical protein